MTTIKNRDADDAATALYEIGKTRMPTALAIRVAKARRAVVNELQDVEDARLALIAGLTGGAMKIRQSDMARVLRSHGNWEEFETRFFDLMAEEFEAPDHFVLYERSGGGEDSDPEYSWTPTFNKTVSDIEPNVLFAMGGMLEIKNVTVSDNGQKPETED